MPICFHKHPKRIFTYVKLIFVKRLFFMKNISNISFNKIHYYADLQFNILYYNRSITEITNVLTYISYIYNLKV